MKKATIVAMIVAVLLFSLITPAQPALPGLSPLVVTAYSSDISLGKPAAVTPGSSFTFTLTGGVGQPSAAYMVTVTVIDGKLRLLNYSLSVSYSAGKVTVSVPNNVRPGVYDLVLIGQQKLEIPRSVWVVNVTKTTLRVVHVSDQHYGAGQPDILTGDMNRVAGYLVASLLNPDLIIDTGDLGDTANEPQYRWAYSYERAFLYGFPIFAVPGNHDTPPGAWSKYYGSTTWYRLIADRLLVIGLYSYEQGYPPLDQLQWAESVLKQYSGTPFKVIFVHHPVFYYQGELKTTYDDASVIAPYDPQKNPNSPLYSSWSGNMEATRYFLRLVEGYNVNLVLSGHVHRDLYVKYMSTRTGKTTYFVTTTTLGMGSAIYDGLAFFEINLENGNITFPVRPPTFKGFAYDPKKLAQNSIPIGIYPPKNNLGVSNQVFTPSAFFMWPRAYVLTVENKLGYLDLDNTVVWCLPWSGDFSPKVVEASGGARFDVLDALRVGDLLYVAARVKLPPGGKLVVALSSGPDTEPPKIRVKVLIPEKPAPGGQFQAFVEASDGGWGVANFTASLLVDGVRQPLTVSLYTPGTLVDPIDSMAFKLVGTLPANAGNAKLVLSATDYAGHSTTLEYTLLGKAEAQQPVPQPVAQPVVVLAVLAAAVIAVTVFLVVRRKKQKS
ncbi:metallophosphoesterase [Infirmifilum lucidum]|uniref:Metallophosphoesterase n=1 Tax=Infirmifilum lucidum TaxID=2776706 RepID=A0A7L9FGI7_9CREN|nr:metallophosphoesterase [Infirmifilum lucidum]QOJ78741.1 metallophosphoesterase [Infirmifilum lucidum]